MLYLLCFEFSLGVAERLWVCNYSHFQLSEAVFAARYGVVTDKPGEYCLYTTTIPAKRNSKRQDSSFVIRWDPLKAAVIKAVNAGSEILSALAVRY